MGAGWIPGQVLVAEPAQRSRQAETARSQRGLAIQVGRLEGYMNPTCSERACSRPHPVRWLPLLILAPIIIGGCSPEEVVPPEVADT